MKDATDKILTMLYPLLQEGIKPSLLLINKNLFDELVEQHTFISVSSPVSEDFTDAATFQFAGFKLDVIKCDYDVCEVYGKEKLNR